jgi:hypothetical protein
MSAPCSDLKKCRIIEEIPLLWGNAFIRIKLVPETGKTVNNITFVLLINITNSDIIVPWFRFDKYLEYQEISFGGRKQ